MNAGFANVKNKKKWGDEKRDSSNKKKEFRTGEKKKVFKRKKGRKKEP